MIQDFFNGKDNNFKQKLVTDINHCIENENFERAAKLRDIYQSLSKFTEKQTVTLSEFINGVVAKIRQIESQWILIILHFQQGRLVDVIRSKESIDEVDKDQLIMGIELEFGNCSIKDDLIISQWIKKIKLIRKELIVHFDQFLQSFIASSAWQEDSVVNDILKWLQSRYHLAYYPLHIECLDISHFSGDRASGWLSSMDSGVLNKKWYRRYKIKQAVWGDDYGSLREIIIRRFAKKSVIARNRVDHNDEIVSANLDKTTTSEESWFLASSQWQSFLPDLFILDGAEKQLEVVKKLFEVWVLDKGLLDKVQFVSLGKWDARKSWQKIKGEKEKLYVLQYHSNTSDPLTSLVADSHLHSEWHIVSYEFQYDEVDRILLRLRDEAHRFANVYREKQQSMELKYGIKITNN